MSDMPKDAKAFLTKAVNAGSSRRVACERKLVEAALGPKAAEVLKTSRGNSKEYCDLSRKVLKEALGAATPATA